MTCAGCDAKDREIAWLRGQIEARQAVPVMASPLRPTPGAPAVESFTDEQGQVWVSVNGGAVKLEEYERFLRGEVGAVLRDGSTVSREETARAVEMLDYMVNGGRLS